MACGEELQAHGPEAFGDILAIPLSFEAADVECEGIGAQDTDAVFFAEGAALIMGDRTEGGEVVEQFLRIEGIGVPAHIFVFRNQGLEEGVKNAMFEDKVGHEWKLRW